MLMLATALRSKSYTVKYSKSELAWSLKLFSRAAGSDDELTKLQQKSSSLQIYVYF